MPNAIENNESGLSVRNKINASFTELAQKEVTANKSQDVETDKASTTKFPSVKAIFDWATGLFEKISYKSQNIVTDKDSVYKYPSTKAVYDRIESRVSKTNHYVPAIVAQQNIEECEIEDFIWWHTDGIYHIVGIFNLLIIDPSGASLSFSLPVESPNQPVFGLWNSENGISGIIKLTDGAIKLNFPESMSQKIVLSAYGEL